MAAGVTCGCRLVPSQLTKLAPIDFIVVPPGSGARLGMSDQEVLAACQSLLQRDVNTCQLLLGLRQLPGGGRRHSQLLGGALLLVLPPVAEECVTGQMAMVIWDAMKLDHVVCCHGTAAASKSDGQ